MKKVTVKINPLKIIDKVDKISIYYRYDEDIDEEIPYINFDNGKFNNIDAKIFLQYLEKNANNINYAFEKIIGRYLKNDKIIEIEKEENNEDKYNPYFILQTMSGKQLKISYNFLMRNTSIEYYIHHMMNEDFYDIYNKNKDEIQNIYVYNSQVSNSVNFIVKNTNDLYVVNNINDNCFNSSEVTRKILKDFTLTNISDGYSEDEDKIYLSLAGDRKIIIDKRQLKDIYKKIINDFNDELIDMKTKKYSYRKVD